MTGINLSSPNWNLKFQVTYFIASLLLFFCVLVVIVLVALCDCAL